MTSATTRSLPSSAEYKASLEAVGPTGSRITDDLLRRRLAQESQDPGFLHLLHRCREYAQFAQPVDRITGRPTDPEWGIANALYRGMGVAALTLNTLHGSMAPPQDIFQNNGGSVNVSAALAQDPYELRHALAGQLLEVGRVFTQGLDEPVQNQLEAVSEGLIPTVATQAYLPIGCGIVWSFARTVHTRTANAAYEAAFADIVDSFEN